MKNIFITFFILNTFLVDAQDFPEVTISGTQVRTITSSIVKSQEYKLEIMLPGGYAESDKSYPVVYLMDSQWDFPLVNSIYGEQYYDGFIPEVIIVGVTWGGENPNPDVLRTRDYTPTNDGRKMETSGADKFLDFFDQELFPFMEKNYKVNDHRTLMGCSLGGLFTLYTLFTRPEMFTGYAAASPAVAWDNGVLYIHEKEFATKQLDKPVSVYMTIGDVELSKSYYKTFAENMVKRKYKNVRLHSKVLENTGHSGTKSETYTRGLQYIFERNQLELSDKELNKYVGTYQFEDGSTIEIKNEGNALQFYFSSENSISLLANTKTHFYATFSFFNVHFKEDNGEVNGFDLVQYGRTRTLSKIK